MQRWLDATILVVGVAAMFGTMRLMERAERRRLARAWQQPRVACAHCGKVFRLGDNGRHTTCSPECAHAWRKEG